MTATTCSHPLAGVVPATMRPLLEQIHAPWLDEVTAMLEPAQHDEAGIWTRWTFIRYLNTTFAQRLAREREALAGVPKHLTDSEATTLWALGELLDLECKHLHHLVGLCQHGTEFTAFAKQFVETLEQWCHAIEGDVGRVSWSEIPEPFQELLIRLTHESTAHAA
jgi:hypothetical protein